ncbi:MAG: carboxypeptidase-like regulatory domain-containing protein [Candidatus Acidiferrales bacterium]
MKILFRAFALTILFASFTYAAPGGVISGTVKGPDGSTFKGAFVRAQSTKTKITVNVLSDRNGAYRIQNLDAGEYLVTAVAVGYKSDPRTNVKVDTDQPVFLDFALQKGTVRWADLSIHEGQVLMPEGAGKQLLFYRCMSCHGLQTKIAAVRRDEEGWQNCVALMRDRATVRAALAICGLRRTTAPQSPPISAEPLAPIRIFPVLRQTSPRIRKPNTLNSATKR